MEIFVITIFVLLLQYYCIMFLLQFINLLNNIYYCYDIIIILWKNINIIELLI